MIHLKKIINAQQIRDADAYTINKESISSIDLMERASQAFVEEFLRYPVEDKKIAVICGTGNNGGDGFAIARMLIQQNLNVHPFLIQFSETLSHDGQINFSRLQNVTIIKTKQEIPSFESFHIIIDALLGSGMNRPAMGLVGNSIEAINSAKKTIFSVDIPSGLFCDEISQDGSIIQSAHVISFQRPKYSFFFPENNSYIKNWKIIDIGLDEPFIQQQESSYFVLDHEIAELLKPRERYSHKGTYGHALLVAGSHGKMGAALLAAKGCLRSGVGLLTTYIPKTAYQIMQTSVPEAMCITDENETIITSFPSLSNYNVIGIGPGLGTHPMSIKMMSELLKQQNTPMIIDADAINILSNKDHLIQQLPKDSILTPHLKEFDRLVGASYNALERFEKQRKFSLDHQCIVVLKDAHTCISDTKGNLYFNTSGNPGMATGGSGDVLTGIITGLVAQAYSSLEAALLGVYYHGVAGDMAAETRGQIGLTASDIVEHLKIQ